MAIKEKDEKILIDFLNHKYKEGSEPEFVKRCDSVILDFFDFCQYISKGLKEIKLYEARKFQEYLLRKGLAKGTVNGYISILRVFYNYLNLIETVEMNPFHLLSSMNVIPIDPTYVPMDQIKRIFKSLDSGMFAPIHYLAIFECLYATGITGMELMFLRPVDFNRDMESLIIRATKRKKEREVPMPAQSVYVLKHYINHRQLHFPMSNFLIVTPRGCKLYYKVLNNAIKHLLSSTSARQKGVPIIKNTYRQHLLDLGVRIQTVGLLTGKRMQALVRHRGWKIVSKLKLAHNMYHPRA